ncbi:hypothetical protein FB567DRAFT_550767 [Paraphoma chrysanthemicola]|uniref:Uncharacterized protein n=1 Tax=Paraphoma chrysanthemicola TaxID=798071 RepID=A0A8K0R4G9_9PLEO|nr:hypothetical protein FB567DRAFT_550767 [Paraphoma chrysanthemicola]
MHVTSLYIVLFAGFGLAARWAIDGSCDFVPTPNLGGGYNSILQATEALEKAVKEAIKMAKSAVNVMTEHSEDQHVRDMLKLVFGEGPEYQSKFDATKSERPITIMLAIGSL